MNRSKLRDGVRRLASAVLVLVGGSAAQAFDAYPVVTDPNNDGLLFGGVNVYANGPFGFDDSAVSNGNDLLVYSWGGTSTFVGAGFSVSVSNGENGIDVTFDGATNQDQNDDVPNTEPVNAAIEAANGGPGNRLQNGNVIRFSAWMRQDPDAPVTVVPSVETLLKAEFWKEALSENADFNPNQDQPLYGDKIFDVDQHGGTLGIPEEDQADWVDINNDGMTSFGLPVSASLTTDAWTLVEHVHTVNEFDWLGIGDDIYTVADVEEIRLSMFIGDYTGGSLGDLSAIWADNILVEFFADANSVTPNLNPMPLDNPDTPGDFDGDGDVDGDDFLTWQQGFGTTYDGNDFLIWQQNFGGGTASSGVPEPTTAALALLAALTGIVCWRR